MTADNTKKGYKTLKRDAIIVFVLFVGVFCFQLGRSLGRNEGIKAIKTNCWCHCR